MMESVLEETAVAPHEAEVPSELIVLDRTGDTRLQWSRKNPEQIKAARARFDELKSQGYVAHRVNGDGSMGGELAAFDETVERTIMHRRLVGG